MPGDQNTTPATRPAGPAEATTARVCPRVAAAAAIDMRQEVYCKTRHGRRDQGGGRAPRRTNGNIGKGGGDTCAAMWSWAQRPPGRVSTDSRKQQTRTAALGSVVAAGQDSRCLVHGLGSIVPRLCCLLSHLFWRGGTVSLVTEFDNFLLPSVTGETNKSPCRVATIQINICCRPPPLEQ